ncbi:MAG: hypothetical protein HGA62_08270 [Chlorobiaceae bacterium]|nr:hypothetical protein [Chlorobiaceae bacterium]NTV61091.1 hypothetical protein [Chlorobiaceae bacterium]
MTTDTTRQKAENGNNSPFENVKLFFNKIMGVPAEPETSPLSKGIGSEIPMNSGDEPIKWPLPVKK